MAQRLLQTTDRAFQLIVSDGWLAGVLRSKIIAKVAATAMRFERVRKLAFCRKTQPVLVGFALRVLSRIKRTLLPVGKRQPASLMSAG